MRERGTGRVGSRKGGTDSQKERVRPGQSTYKLKKTGQRRQ